MGSGTVPRLPFFMLALLTWPAYGTWLAGSARGRVDAGPWRPGDAAVPEPDEALSESRRRSLRWPAVRLDEPAARALLADLERIARLRRFVPEVVVVAPDHVHLLLDAPPDRTPVPTLVHHVKGALSRALSVAAGDHVARSTGGADLPHHKWWTRQYSFRWLDDGDHVAVVRRRLLGHGDALIRSSWPGSSPPSTV